MRVIITETREFDLKFDVETHRAAANMAREFVLSTEHLVAAPGAVTERYYTVCMDNEEDAEMCGFTFSEEDLRDGKATMQEVESGNH